MKAAGFPLTVFYDASCPVCALEMDVLRRRDDCDRLNLVDMSAVGFDASVHGFDAGALDAVIHAVRPDGTVLRGMDVLREAYAGVGLGALLRATRWPLLKPVFDAAYAGFARHRHALSRAVAPLIRVAQARRGTRP